MGHGYYGDSHPGGQDLPACSTSAVDHCRDNAACEGFFGQLKRERVVHQSYRTLDEAQADLFDYIERLHNPRMLRGLGGVRIFV